MILGLTASPVKSVVKFSSNMDIEKDREKIELDILELGNNLDSNFVYFNLELL
jgi:hypothetical protein